MGGNIRGGDFLGGSFPDIVKGIYLRISVKIPQTCVRCSWLQLSIGYLIYFKFKSVFFWWMFFNPVKETNRFRKEINRLLNKEMSNIYLKVTIEKKWPTHNFNFKSLKSLSPGQFLGSSNLRKYHWILKLLVAI